jgi:hypothetical protein
MQYRHPPAAVTLARNRLARLRSVASSGSVKTLSTHGSPVFPFPSNVGEDAMENGELPTDHLFLVFELFEAELSDRDADCLLVRKS